MNDDYLWDRTGPPDPEIQRLEAALAPLRYHPRAGLSLPGSQQSSQQSAPPGRNPTPYRRVWWTLAAAAGIAMALAIPRLMVAPSQATSWKVESAEGSAKLGSQDAAVAMPVRTRELLRTGRASDLTLEADDLGRIDLGPDSELSAAAPSQMLLRRGTLHAFIWAKPRKFVVDTPSSRAVDLGCEYTLNVDAAGNGLVKVTQGWVAFQFHDRESFIPAGAACVTSKRNGPGIPFYEDASEGFRAALAAWERGDSSALYSPPGRGLLDLARQRDALTLWHLLTRVREQDRGAVFDSFAQVVDLLPEVTREGVLRGDPHMIDLCWDALGLENTGWWRGWERRWN